MTRPENTLEYGRTVGEAATQKTANLPLYRSVLQEPTVLLAGNSNDRPDVATAAIPGFN